MKLIKLFLFILFFTNLKTFAQDLSNHKIFIRITADAYRLINNQSKNSINTNRFLLLFENSNPYQILNVTQSFWRLENEELQRTFKVEINKNAKLDEIIEFFSKNKFIEYAEKIPDFQFSDIPNDIGASNYTGQYYLWNIEAEKAWDITKGSDSITIAVIDSEFDYSHEDLKNKIWINQDEIPNNQIDDDHDGYVDNINGWDVANNDNDVKSPFLNFYHGTAVSGLICAETNNNKGIASLGYNLKVLPIKTSNDSFPLSKNLYNVEEAFIYAIEMGANIINCSFVSPNNSKTIEDLINFTINKGIIVVAAAGNNNLSNKFYPAAYNGVIAVGSTDINNEKAFFSNYGHWIKISAPGLTIKTTFPNNNYDSISGSSFSSALVTAALGLMKSYDREINNEALISCLLNSTDSIQNISPEYLGKMGSGTLNVFKSLKCIDSLSKLNTIAEITKDKENICPGYSIQFTGNTKFYEADSFVWLFENGIPQSSNLKNPIISYNNAGNYDVQLIIKNKKGIDTLLLADFAQVNSKGIETFINQNFESPADYNNPLIQYSDTTNTYIVLDSIPSKQGKSVLYFNGNNYTNNQIEFLDLGYISIKNRRNTTLSFDYAYSNVFNNKDSLYILVKSGNNPNWDTLFSDFLLYTYTQTPNNFPQSADDWTLEDNRFLIHLGKYEDRDSIKIRIQFKAENNSILFLDNLEIAGNCAQINDKKPKSIFSYKIDNKCAPAKVQFSNKSEFYPDSFFWFFNGASPAQSNEENPEVIYNEGGKFDVSLITKNSFGYDTLIMSELIQLEEKINLQFSPSLLEICQEDTIEISISGASNYTWFPKLSSKSLSPNNDRIIFYPRNSFDYQIKSSNEIGCSKDTIIRISVKPKPMSPTIGKRNDSLISSIDSNGFNYFWYLNQNLLTQKNGPNIKIDEIGIYELIIENSLNCSSISNPYWVQELNSSKPINSISLFPNPANNYVIISEINEPFEFFIFNASGKLIKHSISDTNKIEVKSIPNGIYFLKIQSENFKINTKLIIMH